LIVFQFHPPILIFHVLFFYFSSHSFDFWLFSWPFCKKYFVFNFILQSKFMMYYFFSIWSSFFYFFCSFIKVFFLFDFTLPSKKFSCPLIYFYFNFIFILLIANFLGILLYNYFFFNFIFQYLIYHGLCLIVFHVYCFQSNDSGHRFEKLIRVNIFF